MKWGIKARWGDKLGLAHIWPQFRKVANVSGTQDILNYGVNKFLQDSVHSLTIFTTLWETNI